MKQVRLEWAKSRRRARKRGSVLVEATIGMAILSAGLAIAAQEIAKYHVAQKAKVVAEKLVEVSDASQMYLKSHYAQLLDQTALNGVTVIPIGRPSATAAVPKGPGTLPSVQGAGFLNISFIDKNGFGQRHALLVKKVTAERLEALITTYGGQTIGDFNLAQIGINVGNTGGYVLAKPPRQEDQGMIMGAYGGYRSKASDWGNQAESPKVGHLQSSLAIQSGVLLTDYLYRNDIGIPAANRMNTSIDMNGNDINNAQLIETEKLNASIDVWAKRDVLADNDVIAGRNVTAGVDISARNDVHAQRNVIAENDVVAENDLEVGSNASIGQNLNVGNEAFIARNLTVDAKADLAKIDLNRTVAIIPGRFTEAQNIKLANLLPRQVAQYSYLVKPGEIVPKPSCGNDGKEYNRARIFVYRQVESTKGYPQVRLDQTWKDGYLTSVVQDIPESFVNMADGIVAKNNGLSWTIDWYGGLEADGASRQAIAQTYCHYG